MPDRKQGSELVLIRHAQSEWNAAGRWQGHADPPLSQAGRDQADALAGAFSGERIDRLYSSDLLRARETAEAVGAILGTPILVDLHFRELDIGRWSGLVREEIESLEPDLLEAFESGDPHVRPGGGETRAELRQRARDRVVLLAAEHPGERIVVVTHLGFIRALLPDENPDNASATRVPIERALTARSPSSTPAPRGPL